VHTVTELTGQNRPEEKTKITKNKLQHRNHKRREIVGHDNDGDKRKISW
jgi:hypothetical protein